MSLLREPLKCRPGLQLGTVTPGEAPPPTVCFDRLAVYALDPDSPARLRWRHGDTPPDPDAFPGDPEFLTGWIAAAATPAGVLALHSAGHLLLLDSDTGAPHWQLELGPLPVARLHAGNRTACILWKKSGRTRAAFVGLSSPPAATPATVDTAPSGPRPTISDLGTDWPLWSGLWRDELLLVTGPRVDRYSRTGRVGSFRLDCDSPTTAAIALFVPPGPPAETTPTTAPTSSPAAGRPAPPARLLVACDTQLAAYDLDSGAQIWAPHNEPPAARDHDSPGTPPAAASPITALRILGPHALLSCGTGATALDAATGTVAATLPLSPPRQGLANTLAALQLRTLYRDADRPDAPLTLASIPLSPAATSQPAATLSAPDLLVLPPAHDLRTVLWTDTHLILVESNRLSAFALPPAPSHNPYTESAPAAHSCGSRPVEN
jgi:hypothetical protein